LRTGLVRPSGTSVITVTCYTWLAALVGEVTSVPTATADAMPFSRRPAQCAVHRDRGLCVPQGAAIGCGIGDPLRLHPGEQHIAVLDRQAGNTYHGSAAAVSMVTLRRQRRNRLIMAPRTELGRCAGRHAKANCGFYQSAWLPRPNGLGRLIPTD
jgi:hypothetical protein